MPSYYEGVLGNLYPGDIAKASDIHQIQQHIIDAFKNELSDFHDQESYVLGSGEKYQKSFILTPAPKYQGLYVDSRNDVSINESEKKYIDINHYSVKQPILKTKSTLYSVVVKFINTFDENIEVKCHLKSDDSDSPIRTNTITVAPTTDGPEKYEVVFDLNFYPTPPGYNYEDLIERDGKDIVSYDTKEESFDEGYSEDYENDPINIYSYTSGVPKLYFVIDKVGKTVNTVDTTSTTSSDAVLGVYYGDGSDFVDKDIYLEIDGGSGFEKQEANLWYLDIYANEMTYLCSGGEAIINGEKVQSLDSHISIEGGSSMGNTLTQIYLDDDGHLQASNKQTSLTTDIDSFEEDIDDPLPSNYLPIALILTYWNAQYGLSKEPLIIQDDSYGQRPPSHHERLRRLEKQMDWSNDIALPGRIKKTLSDGDWIDNEGDKLTGLPNSTAESNQKDADTVGSENIFLTTDEQGNIVARLSKSATESFPITLKEELKDSDGKTKKLEPTDVLNISSFSKLDNMVHDSKKGTLTLAVDKTNSDKSIATTAKEAKLTEFNPWDDSAANRPSGEKYDKTEREYTVVSGKNGTYDRASSYPGMTFYTKTNYKMKKLTIPIHKFKNCSAVKFFIWKRQESNNKKNRVWLKKLYKSKEFSLKKAKTKGQYQYMDKGFTINFGKDGLSLPKGQYVIIALPVPKSGKGSLFVETYKPKNSKDFCIKYVGTADASHFRLNARYQEIWYNSASAIVEEEKYETKGTAISNTYTWEKTNLERITSVKPIVGNNLKGGKEDSWELYVSTGGNWVKVTPGEDNTISNGGARTFKWKLVFKSKGNSTPTLSYSSKKKYAIKFIITRDKAAGWQSTEAVATKDKNMCITSKPFDGDDTLREYIGDPNFGLEHSRFEGYEFARVWADETLNKKLLMDIQASDYDVKFPMFNEDGSVQRNNETNQEIISDEIPLWSLHYCDLTLNDFAKINVDYSNYIEELEYDENNMRLKLDSEHSYNDNEILIAELKDFTKTETPLSTSETDEDGEEKEVLTNDDTTSTNQLFLKKTFDNTIDLTKYSGLKFKFKVGGFDFNSSILTGLGIYISSIKEDSVPSDLKDPESVADELSDVDVVPIVYDADFNFEEKYMGKILKIKHDASGDEEDGDKAYNTGYYQYVKHYDSNREEYVYKLEQVFDLRTYNIYKIAPIKQSSGKSDEFEVRIEIDQDSNNLKNVKEIGIISLNDEGSYKVEQTSKNTKIGLTCTELKKVIVEVKDDSNNPVGGGQIIFRDELLNLDGYGKVELGENCFQELSEENLEIEFPRYKTDEVEYEKSSISFSCDFNPMGISNQTLTDIEYDASSITADYTKETELVASTNDDKTAIIVKLKEKNSSTVLKKKNITLNESTTLTTNDNGEVQVSVNDANTIEFAYNQEDPVKGNDNKTTFYKPCKLSVTYNLKPIETRVIVKEKEYVDANKIALTLNSVQAIREDCLKIYDPTNKIKFITKENEVTKVFRNKEMVFDKDTYLKTLSGDVLNKVKGIVKTTPATTQININYMSTMLKDRPGLLCYVNNPFSGGVSKYKHIGIQIAADTYIPKDCLIIDICEKPNGESPIASVNLPTMNTIFYPNTGDGTISLSQVFKKLDIDDTEIKSIGIRATKHLQQYMKDILDETNKPKINLFIGNIVLYRAETIPIYHNKMRFKFYSATNGQIDHSSEQVTTDTISIRKIGAVLEYK